MQQNQNFFLAQNLYYADSTLYVPKLHLQTD